MEYTVEQKELMLRSKAWPDRWAMAREGYRLDVLMYDEEAHVRYAVAKQGYGLDVLVHDEDVHVRDMAVQKLKEKELEERKAGMDKKAQGQDLRSVFVLLGSHETRFGVDTYCSVHASEEAAKANIPALMEEADFDGSEGEYFDTEVVKKEIDVSLLPPTKVQSSVQLDGAKIEKALECLRDNGIEEDECENVLQALGYILLDQELFPEMNNGKLIGDVGKLIEEAGEKVGSHGDGDGLTAKGKADELVMA